MGKRKQSIPVRSSEEKRQRSTWSMVDGSLTSLRDSTIGQNQADFIPTTTHPSQTDFIPSTTHPSPTHSLHSDAFEENLKSCIFFLNIQCQPQFKLCEWHAELANFTIQLHQNDRNSSEFLKTGLPSCSEFWFYVSDKSGRCMLYFELDENNDSVPRSLKNNGNTCFFMADTSLSLVCLEALQMKKAFQLVVCDFNRDSLLLEVKILITSKCTKVLTYVSEHSKSRGHDGISRALQVLIAQFYKIPYPIKPVMKSGNVKASHEDIEFLYSNIKRSDTETFHDVQHPHLKPRLRQYQKEAVQWMLNREHVIQSPSKSDVHQLYQELLTLDKQTLYYNVHLGWLVKEKPLRRVDLPGGILADEMGLGKTVEVLACILSHPRQNLPLPERLPVIQYNQDLESVEDAGMSSEGSIDMLSTGSHTEHSQAFSDTRLLNEECIMNNISDDQTKTWQPRNCFDQTKTWQPRNCFDQTKTWQPRNCFECICGEKDSDSVKLQCTKCGLWQHSSCVNYDLNNPYRGVYLCPHCHILANPVISGATLIISPGAICHQWEEEIKKHVKEKSLKVFIYSGVSKLGFTQPQTLASYDIVITTYETLRKEIYFVDLPHTNNETGRKLRYPKRFMAIPSPLVAVQWWRICLDEAQMVESVTTRTAEMALRLSAVNRWCVTGTPVQKHIQDLYGLLVFLDVDPYCVKGWWNSLLLDPFKQGHREALLDVMSKVMWRTAKKDVLDQIQLPEQTVCVEWLTFSPVEDHFYRRQYDWCMREAARGLLKQSNTERRLSSLDRQTLDSILHPLLKLRQACCHPQAVRGAFLPLQKSSMTMEDLLKSLTKKATVECEECHRQVVAALNGLAGLHILSAQYVEAVEKYREVFRSIVEHQSNFRTDDLQQLHALHNLKEILDEKRDGILPTLRDDQLTLQAEELRDKYMKKASVAVKQKEEVLDPIIQSTEEKENELEDGDTWWIDLLQWLTYIHQDDTVVIRVKKHLSETAHVETNSVCSRFRDVRGLEYVLDLQLQELESSHMKLKLALKALRETPSQDIVDQTVECCLRPKDRPLKTCCFCKCDDLFSSYESKLFSISERDIGIGPEEATDVHPKRQGNWADSEIEKILKVILSVGKTFNAEKDLLTLGTLHINLFEWRKKEFKASRAVWLTLRERISAIDELSMATTRLRFRLPDEEKTDPPSLHVIEPIELNQLKLRLISDRTVAQNELRKKLGQLLYLKNMAKNESCWLGGSNPDPCPVCQKELGQQWNVLECGHCYCLDCIRIMLEQYSFGGRHKSLRCAMCRQLTRHTNISTVSTKPNSENQTEIIQVKGSHSTKVEAVVRSLLQIEMTEPGAKSLVFSKWIEVLDKISLGLVENGISHKLLHSGRKFQDDLDSFRHDADVKVLLLPLHSGANGLNLIEATHVLLVEPVLNMAEEQQAVGRVHRIGQTKKTQVQRFLVRGTIEERIYHLLSASKTEDDLTVGDLVTLLEDQSKEGEISTMQTEHTTSQVYPRLDSNNLTNNTVQTDAMPSCSNDSGSGEVQTDVIPSCNSGSGEVQTDVQTDAIPSCINNSGSGEVQTDVMPSCINNSGSGEVQTDVMPSCINNSGSGEVQTDVMPSYSNNSGSG